MKIKLVLILISAFCLSFLVEAQEVIINTESAIYTFDIPTCNYQLITEVDDVLFDIAIDTNEKLYGIDPDGKLFLVNMMNGSTTLIHNFTGQVFNSMTISADNKAYISGTGGDLWYYDLENNQQKYLGNIGYAATGDLTFRNGKLYVAISDDQIMEINLLNPASSTIIIKENVTGAVVGIFSYSFDCANTETYVVTDNGSDIYKVDFENKKFNYICNLPIEIFGGASKFEYLGSSLLLGEINSISPDCAGNNGQIVVEAIGGDGVLNYSIDGNPSQTSNVFTDLALGTYDIIVSDENGCMVETTYTIDFMYPDFINDIVVNPTTCGLENGLIDLSQNDQIISASFDNSAFTTEFIYEDLQAGVYTIGVNLDGDCFHEEQVVIEDSDSIFLQINNLVSTSCTEPDGKVEVLIENAFGELDYLLNGTAIIINDVIDNLAEGEYEIMVSDENGCSGRQSFDVLQGECSVYIPNVFNPNSIMGNSTFRIFTNQAYKGQIESFEIFDRWGNLIYTINELNESWDGTFKGEPAASGVYVYKVALINQDQSQSNYYGNITIIR